MAESALKVALLAREGEARGLLRQALADFGAELVLEADPNGVDAAMLGASGARAVLYSVEPATEAALDRLDAVLLDPALGVIFDEAETTAKLSGWDRNRWARHLAAKLLGRDLLPPGGSTPSHPEAAWHLEPGMAAAPILVDESTLSGLTAEADASAPAVPSAPRFETIEPAALDGLELEELNLSEAELAAFGEFERHPPAGRAAPLPEARLDADLDIVLDADADLDADLARLAAELDARIEAQDPPAWSDADAASLALADPPGLADAPADIGRESVEPPAARKFDLSALELAPLDAPAASPAAALPAKAVFADDGGRLALAPIDGEDTLPTAAGRIVLVLSGIGGPDAVRQLLRALPPGFPCAVLLRQSLDGGRHDRFVEQLAKVSRLPVALASVRETPPLREVRVLEEGMLAAGTLRFEGGIEALLIEVLAADGAVVVLSGAEPALLPPLQSALAEGRRVIVQDPSTCFEPATAEALRAAGAPAVAAGELAARLDACFPT